ASTTCGSTSRAAAWSSAAGRSATRRSRRRLPRLATRWHRDPGGGLMASGAEHLELPIAGMTCASCARRIERRLNRLESVSASVNYATEKATVDFDPAAVRPEQLVEAVAEAGYEAVLPSAEAQSAEPTETDETASLRQRLLI